MKKKLTMKKKLIIAAILILFMVIILESCGFTDPTKPVAQLYEAIMRGDCQRVGELWTHYDPQKHVARCEEHRGEITSYQIIGVEGRAGIPGLLEWASVKVRLEFTDRPPSEGNLQVTRQFFGGWHLTEII